MGWLAGGQRADRWARGLWARSAPSWAQLPGHGVRGGGQPTDASIVRRYARGLALHHRDHVLPNDTLDQALPTTDDGRQRAPSVPELAD